jgi:hypothetical protein
VTGADGKSERLFEQIRVENPGNETVLPQVRSGLAISSLTFDGKIVVVTDTGGNTIVVPATQPSSSPPRKPVIKGPWERGEH